MTETNTLHRVKAATKNSTNGEISKVAITAFSVTAGLIGLWAVVCLSSAFMSEGPLSLLKSLFGAVSGTM